MYKFKNIPLDCFHCRLNKYLFSNDLYKNNDYLSKQLLNIASLKEDFNICDFDKILFNEYKKIVDVEDYSKVKPYYNQLLESHKNNLLEKINNSKDPILVALKYTLQANYIDFASQNNINEDKMWSLLLDSENIDLDMNVYSKFIDELSKAKNLVYLIDNCGEIVLDKILIEKIIEKYPNISITAVVRGQDVINDCTMNDALQIGLDKVCNVIDNGDSNAGTYLDKISKECLDLINNADLIISKGQGNAESLFNSKLNIYYVLLCKCDYFAKLFNTVKYKAILSRELDR